MSQLCVAMASSNNMRTGGAVLLIAFVQVLVGVILLGLYEAYKVKFVNEDMSLQVEHFRNVTRFQQEQLSKFQQPGQQQWQFPPGQQQPQPGQLPAGSMPNGGMQMPSEDDIAASAQPRLRRAVASALHLQYCSPQLAFCVAVSRAHVRTNRASAQASRAYALAGNTSAKQVVASCACQMLRLCSTTEHLHICQAKLARCMTDCIKSIYEQTVAEFLVVLQACARSCQRRSTSSFICR